MTATNMCYNFVGFRYSLPTLQVALRSSFLWSFESEVDFFIIYDYFVSSLVVKSSIYSPGYEHAANTNDTYGHAR